MYGSIKRKSMKLNIKYLAEGFLCSTSFKALSGSQMDSFAYNIRVIQPCSKTNSMDIKPIIIVLMVIALNAVLDKITSQLYPNPA